MRDALNIFDQRVNNMLKLSVKACSEDCVHASICKQFYTIKIRLEDPPE